MTRKESMQMFRQKKHGKPTYVFHLWVVEHVDVEPTDTEGWMYFSLGLCFLIIK
jgi:hypothetical protein